jgi:hypothetical protein
MLHETNATIPTAGPSRMMTSVVSSQNASSAIR